jgi:nitrile hydratase accessory protein
MSMTEIKELIAAVEREDPVFEEPWQADSFIMAIALARSGVYTWPEWVERFAETIKDNPQQDGESTNQAYYRQWLTCLEAILGDRSVFTMEELESREASWRLAYLRTPHGSPVELAMAAQLAENADDVEHDDHHHHAHHDHHHGFADECGVPGGHGSASRVAPLKVFSGQPSKPRTF